MSETVLAALRERLVTAVGAARRVEVAGFEEQSFAVVRARLVPRAEELARQLLAILDAITCSLLAGAQERVTETALVTAPESDSGRAFYRSVDAVVASELVGWEHLVDLCLLVEVELERKLRALATAVERADTWACLAACSSLLRKLAKAGAAIENLLARRCGIPQTLDYADELAISLEVRTTYARFRLRLRSDPGVGLAIRLRHAANAIAWLVGRDAYPLVRIGDRITLRSLQARIVRWLGQPAACAVDGERLWTDLIGFLALLGQINLREELVEHDRQLLAELTVPGAACPRHRVVALLGRDEALDRLLLERATPASAIAERLRLLAGTGELPPVSFDAEAAGARREPSGSYELPE